MVAAPHEGLGQPSPLHIEGAPTGGLYPSSTRGIEGGWVDAWGRVLFVPKRGGGWRAVPTIPLPSPRLDPWLSDIPPALPLSHLTLTMEENEAGAYIASLWRNVMKRSSDTQLAMQHAETLEAADAFDLALRIVKRKATWGLEGAYAERAAAAVLSLSLPPKPNLMPGAQATPRVSLLCLATGFARLAMQGGIEVGPTKERKRVARAIRTALRWVEFGSAVYAELLTYEKLRGCAGRPAAADNAAT